MKNCCNCGHQLSDQTVFCNRCGAKQPMVQTQNPEPAAEKKNKRWLIPVVVAAAIILIAASVVAVFLFKTKAGSNSGSISLDHGSWSELDDFGKLRSRIVSVTNSHNAIVLNPAEQSSQDNSDGTLTVTGILMDDGRIMTTSNAVDGQGEIIIQFADGSSEKARVVSNDIYTNIAILELIGFKGKHANSYTGFPFDHSALQPTDNMYIVGFTDDDPSVPVVQKVSSQGSVPHEDKDLIVVDSTAQNMNGALLVGEDGTVYGMNMLNDKEDNISLVLSSEDLETEVLSQYTNLGTGSESVSTSGRENIYLNTISENYDTDISALAVQYDSNSWITASGITGSDYSFTIDQRSGELVKLNYLGNSENGDEYQFGKDELSVATALTGNGEYTCIMNRYILRPGESGFLLLDFEGLEGVIKRITISNVDEGTGELVFIFDDPDEASDLTAAVVEEKNAKEALKQKAYAAAIEVLEANSEGILLLEKGTRIPPESQFVFDESVNNGGFITIMDINNDDIPELFFNNARHAQSSSTSGFIGFKIFSFDGEKYNDITDISFTDYNFSGVIGMEAYFYSGELFRIDNSDSIYIYYCYESYYYGDGIIKLEEFIFEDGTFKSVNKYEMKQPIRNDSSTYYTVNGVASDESTVMDLINGIYNQKRHTITILNPSLSYSKVTNGYTYDEAIRYLQSLAENN